MLYIKKQDSVPITFLKAVNSLNHYDELQGDNKKTVTTLLLEEQCNLCAICERKSGAFIPTIEHFMPNSIYPHLGLDYYNLYASCSKCNEPKANHLIPAYIFDPRFSPFYSGDALKPKYALNEDTGICNVVIQEANTINYKTPPPYAAYLMQSTIDLLNQNRGRDIINEAESNTSLVHLRGRVAKQLIQAMSSLPYDKLREKYEKLKHIYNHQENAPMFLSMQVFYLRKRLNL